MSKKSLLSMVAVTLAFSSSAFANWTALAYNSQTHHWGRSQCAFDYNSAVNTALNYCGGGCQIVAYSDNGWVSLAVADNNAVFGTGDEHQDQFSTEQSSLERCQEHAGASCHTLVDGYAFNCQ